MAFYEYNNFSYGDEQTRSLPFFEVISMSHFIYGFSRTHKLYISNNLTYAKILKLLQLEAGFTPA